MYTSNGSRYFKGPHRLHVGHFSHTAGHTAWHDHPFSEISVVLEGAGWYHSPGHRHRLARGQVFWVRPGVPHHYLVEKRHRVINLLVGDEFLALVSKWTGSPQALAGPVGRFLSTFLSQAKEGAWALRPVDLMPMVRDFEDLEATLERDRSAMGEMGALALLGLCRRLLQGKALGPSDGEARSVEKILGTQKWVMENLAEHFTLQDLAARVGWTGATLSRAFRRQTGYALFGYIAALRVARACERLRSTEDAILDIALDSGFTNVSFFNRVFLRECGMTPGAYRRRHRRT